MQKKTAYAIPISLININIIKEQRKKNHKVENTIKAKTREELYHA